MASDFILEGEGRSSFEIEYNLLVRVTTGTCYDPMSSENKTIVCLRYTFHLLKHIEYRWRKQLFVSHFCAFCSPFAKSREQCRIIHSIT